MRIGITFDLRSAYLASGFGEEETAEFDRESTIEAIEAALHELGHQTDRIGHLPDLMGRLLAGDRWDLVFNTAEGLRGYGRESEVPALLEAWGIAYTFADPLVAAVTLHKGVAKRLMRDLGVPTGDFCVVENDAQARAVELPFPLFVKPVAEGTAKGIDAGSRVSSRTALVARCRWVRERHAQPALVEPFLPGREFTTGIVGCGDDARALGTLEVLLRPEAEAHCYSYENKEHYEDLCDYRLADSALAEACARISLDAWRGIGGRDAGRIDLRLDALGRPQVLEINPLPGLHPVHSDLPMICNAVGVSYSQLIGEIVASASLRRASSDRRLLAPPALAGASATAA